MGWIFREPARQQPGKVRALMKRPAQRLGRWLWRLGLFAGLALLLLAIPSVWIETSCHRPRASALANAGLNAGGFKSVLPREQQRPLVRTFLTYPEWSIVHAYEDLAAVQKLRGESAFDYTASVSGYWNNLCKVYGVASERDSIDTDMRTMLHVIGVSFTAEMAVKGAYEKTIGNLTQWWRGATPSAEDRFALKIAQDYAAFLRQTPWYEFPFAENLSRLWREIPFESAQWLRAVERRSALSLEWGFKAVYAKLIAYAAGLSPAELKNQTVVRGLDASDLRADARIKVIEKFPDGRTVIETPRYRAYTEILQGLAQRKRDLTEIAGNDEIFLTVLTPDQLIEPLPGTREILSARLQGSDGLLRRGIALRVARLSDTLRLIASRGYQLEHVYDY